MHEKDGIWSTGLWKGMLLKMLLSLFMNYPSLYGHVYHEHGNEWDDGIPFYSNDLLLGIMLFCRFYYAINFLLSFSFYTDPRS